MTGFDDLQRELLAAESRLERPTRSRVARPPWRRVPGAGLMATAIAVAVAILVAVGAFALFHRAAPSAPAARPRPAEVRRLISELAVLRSPQTPAARRWLHGEAAARLHHRPAGFAMVPGLTRAISLPDHTQLVLYVVTSTRWGGGGLGYMERSGTSGEGACCISAQQLTRPSGPGPWASRSGRIPPQVYFEIVPDGVSKVRWTFTRHGIFPPPGPGLRDWERRTGRTMAKSYIGSPSSAPLTVTVPVHNNVAARRLPNRGATISDTWLDPAGRAIARHGRP